LQGDQHPGPADQAGAQVQAATPRGHLSGSAPPKDRRKYCDPGEQEQEEGGDVPEGGQYHHAE
jgi:hypothetical protein